MEILKKISHMDIANLELYSAENPVYFAIHGEPFELPNHHWAELLVQFVEHLIESDSPYLKALETTIFYDGSPFLLLKEVNVIGCVKLSTGKWLNTGYLDSELTIIIKKLLAFCNISTNDIMIGYYKNSKYLPIEKYKKLYTKTHTDEKPRKVKEEIEDKNSTTPSQERKTFFMDGGKEYFDVSIDKMKLSVRAYNCLRKQSLFYFSDIYKLKENDLWKIQNLGKKTINEILELKQNINLVLANNHINIIPDICEYIFSSIEKMDIKNKENIKDKISCFINDSFYKNLGNYLLQADFMREILCEHILQTLAKYRYGCKDLPLIATSLPDFFRDEKNVLTVLNDLIYIKKVKIVDHKYTVIHPSILEQLNEILTDKQYSIFKERLEGKTLEEIGKLHNVTRERIRQIEQKAISKIRLQNKIFKEDFLSEIFETYSFTKDEFLLAFGEVEITYNYLNLMYDKGNKTLDEALNDTSTPPYLSEKIRTFLLKKLNFFHKKELYIYKLKNSNGNIACEQQQKDTLNNEEINSFEKILSKHFKNGFKLDSSIELHRFKKFYFNEYENNDKTIDFSKIKYSGVVFKDKVHIIDENSIFEITSLINKVINSGNTAVYYKEFFEKNHEQLVDSQYLSEDIVKNIIINQFPHFIHKKNYFSVDSENTTELTVIKNELLRIWGDKLFLTYNEIRETLPYIPFLKIRNVLFDDNDFIWNSQEEYTHFQKYNITFEECERIQTTTLNVCEEHGFASFSNLPIDDICERNFQFSTPAAQSAIFRICLYEKFERKGRIIAKKGTSENLDKVIKKHCSSLGSITLKELIDLERELTGTVYIWPALAAAYDVLVRVSKDLFVAENKIFFDVGLIDNMLDDFVLGKYLPIKQFPSFATLPDCGYAWNLFLLESYCRRFSEKYVFQTLSYNSKNVGVIMQKSCPLSYFEIMVHAVTESNTTLEPKEIIDFLHISGYIGRRSFSKVHMLIEMIKDIKIKES